MPLSKQAPRFSAESLKFLLKAGRQKRADWLDKHQDEYDTLIRQPLQHLARDLQKQLQSAASGYHFPQKGIGRLRRPAHRAAEWGGIYKNWLAYSASRPTGSRFDHNPNLFFLLNPTDPDDGVLVAGGLYMPSSRQIRSIREALAEDTSAFDKLFASKEFNRRFKGGFSREKMATRPPRGFAPDHPKIDWLKLQAFFVWRRYTLREFSSAGFSRLVASDFKQVLRLNDLLEEILSGRQVASRRAKTAVAEKGEESSRSLLERLELIDDVRPRAHD